jgi:GrpB-like predicted nucleotidyltransferase (UPF0157 family)
MKKVLTIIETEERTAKSGRKYRVSQCIVHGENKRVGELMIFNDQLAAEPGNYEAYFEIHVDYERRITSELVSLKPYTGALPGAGAAPAKAAA